jgi:hypothetical protein
MAKHEQHYFDDNPIKESWLHSHFVLSYDIHNIMDLYVSLEYNRHKDFVTSITFWANTNPKYIIILF